MDTEKVLNDLKKRFSAPLEEYYKRRIIFWLDDEREFEDRLDEIELDGVKIVRLTGRNSFAVKKLLTRDDQTSNYLVYCSIEYENKEDNWLLDIQLYSEEFRADLISIWMDDMRILASSASRRLVKQYKKFFGSQERRAKTAALLGMMNRPEQIHLAVLAVLAGSRSLYPPDILKNVLAAGLRDNAVYQEFEKYGAQDAFWKLVSRFTGFNDEAPNFEHLACHLLLTAATRTLNAGDLAGLERFISDPHQAWCYDLVSDWLHSDEKESLRPIAQFVEDELHLKQRFMNLPVESLWYTECFPCIHACIIDKIMQDICNQLIDVETITQAVEKRRTCTWYGDFAPFYDGALQVANMQRFYLEHAASFHTVEAYRIFQEYTSDYYRMDTYYRLFHMDYQKSLNTFHGELNEHFAQVTQVVEGFYVHGFLDKLGENWTKACEKELKQYGGILEIPRQEDFYNEHVRTADANVVVIISDAFRYETAVSLAEQLKRETQSQVELGAMQGVFPTITKFGMAALLPHEKLTVEERANGTLSVLADGMPTDSAYRDKVLKAANPKSIALQERDVMKMNTEQIRALTTGMEVVYIYHDTVDAASHVAEEKVFDACDEAIQELQNLVKIVINRMNRRHIMITADHGFLYTCNPLQENSKVAFQQKDVEYGRRYAIVRGDAQPEYLMPVKFTGDSAGLAAYAPRENMRLKMSGSGLNFVHGGASLQEMCVPVITVHHLRNDSKEYQRNRSKYDTRPVTISLFSSSRKISNMIFGLNFYQKEAVSDNRSAQTYLLYFADEYGNTISDVQTIIADKTDVENVDRTFRVNFNLKQMKYDNRAAYYLVIADEKGLTAPQKEEFHIDIAFADDFGFF